MGFFNDYFNPFNPDAYGNAWDFYTDDIPGFVGNTIDSFTGEADRKLANKQIANATDAAEKAALIEKYMYDTTRNDTSTARGVQNRTMLGMEQGINEGAYNAPAFNFDYAKYGLTPPPQAPSPVYNQTTANSLATPEQSSGFSGLVDRVGNTTSDAIDSSKGIAEDANNMVNQGADALLQGANDLMGQETLSPNAKTTSGSNSGFGTSLNDGVLGTGGSSTIQPDREGVTDVKSQYTTVQPQAESPQDGGTWYTTPEAPEDFSFTYADFENTPYYQMLQDDSMRGVERSAAARGGLGSGGTMAAIQDRGQAIAGREFQNQYDRAFNTHTNNYGQYQDQRNFDYGKAFDDRGFAYKVAGDDYNRGRNAGLDQFSQQASLLSGTQPAFQSGVNANQGYSSNMGNIYGQQANAMNAGYAAQANAGNRFLDNIFKTVGLGASIYNG